MANYETTRDGARAAVRRGSILVLVLGILALMAVIAAVYVTIGLGDQRAVRAVETRQEHDQIAPEVGDYIAGVIGQDRGAVTWELDSSASLQASDQVLPVLAPYLENTDYPATDFLSRSIPQLAASFEVSVPSLPDRINYYRFRAAGTHPNRVLPQMSSLLDRRIASDPWLASTMPTYLGRPDQRLYPDDPTKWWLDDRDWMQISNLAPDGLFVNLFALRNNFDAPRGFQNQDQMSYWLSLIDKRNDGRLQATQFLPWGDPIGPDEKNRPFYWTMYQRNMYFPIGQPFLMFDRNSGIAGWGSPDYPAYQYADADGDGFADSRWFELRDSTILGQELNLLSDVSDYRLFIAARVVDLSSLINVNVATDDSTPSTTEVPPGASPAEIDLRRILTMEDAASSWRATIPLIADLPLTYSSIPRPNDWALGLNSDEASEIYAEYDDTPLASNPAGTPTRSEMVGRYGYDALRRSIQNDPLNAPADVFGYWGPSYVDISSFQPADELLPYSPFEYTMYLEDSQNPLELNDADVRARIRLDFYDRVGRLDPVSPSFRPDANLTQPDTRFGWNVYGLEDLSELLTYRGLNDPSTRSRLEAASGGRFFADDSEPLASGLSTTQFGPLRSTRGLDVERFGADKVNNGNEFAVGTTPNSDGLPDDDAMALRTLSPRNFLTTVSGGAEISRVALAADLNGRVTGTDISTIGAFKPALLDVAGKVPSMFNIYRRALAPYATIDISWTLDTTRAEYETYRTLSYGYAGPELAIRSAAHMAVNMRDQMDADSSPTVATLIVSRTNEVADNDVFLNNIEIDDINYPGGREADRLTPPYAHADVNGLAESPAINVYGIEPQPFVVEAMSVNVYADAPVVNTVTRPDGYPPEPVADLDYNRAGCIPPGGGVPPLQGREVFVTVGGKLTAEDWNARNATLWEKNPDFLLQVFAVKINNPFNVPITLGAGASGPTEQLSRNEEDGCPACSGDTVSTGPNAFDYYIEFGGRYFKLAQYVAPLPDSVNPDDDLKRSYTLSPVVLQPGETRVFYAMAQEDEEETFNRILRYMIAYGYPGLSSDATSYRAVESMISGWLTLQFGGEMNAPVWMRRFNPETGLLINVASACDVDPDTEPTCRQSDPIWGSAGWTQRLTFEDMWEDPETDRTYREEDDRIFPSPANGGTPRKPDWQIVRMWRKYIAPHDVNDDGVPDESVWLGNQIDPNAAGTDNRIENDILVDRLRESNPQTVYTNQSGYDPNLFPPEAEQIGWLDTRLGFSGGYGSGRGVSPVVDTAHGCEQTTNRLPIVGGYENYNTGITIAPYASIRRHGFGGHSAALKGDEIKRGVLPQWCIETLQSWDSASANPDYKGESTSTNINKGSPFLTALAATNFDQANASRWFGAFFGRSPAGEPIGLVLHRTFPLKPQKWIDGPVNHLQEELYGRTGGIVPIGGPGNGLSINPELHVRNDGFTYNNVDVSRVTDILAPMGIGPENDPLPLVDANHPYWDDNDVNLDGRWLTLGEAFGLALGFERPALIGTYEPVYRKYLFETGLTLTPGDYVFDRCQLALDKFVPFLNYGDADSDGNGIDEVAYDWATDFTMGAALPPAMALLDMVRSGAASEDNRPLPGKVNINTAPLAVLRTIGLLSPSDAFGALGVPQNWVWRLGSEYGGLPPDQSSTPDPYINWADQNLGLPDLALIDTAATLYAYRDRAWQIPFRYSSIPQSLLAAGMNLNSGFVPFEDPGTATVTQDELFDVTPAEERLVGNNRLPDRSNARADTGRESITGIRGLREAPGFASLGELLAAQFRVDFENTYSGNRYTQEEANLAGVDALGRDRRYGGGLPGGEDIELKAYRNTTSGQEFSVRLEPRSYTSEYLADELANDYDEQLAIASQVLNLVTTRSDYFAVWFVLQGYTREDVSNLNGDVNNLNAPNADPMIPSFARRYVMVIDRSRVGVWEDKNSDGIRQDSEIESEPRILLFREVPM